MNYECTNFFHKIFLCLIDIKNVVKAVNFYKKKTRHFLCIRRFGICHKQLVNTTINTLDVPKSIRKRGSVLKSGGGC